MEPRLCSASAAQLLFNLLTLDPSERPDLYSIIEKADFFSEKDRNI
jgi:hypothetical protein